MSDPAAKQSSRDADLAQALEHHRAGRLQEAAHIYAQLCTADRRDTDVLFLMGVLCCDLGAFEPACRFLNEALAIAPTHARARGQLAAALDSLGDVQAAAGELTEAQRYFEQALTWMPDDARTLRSLGRVALLRGDSARAEIFLARSLVHQQDHARPSTGWGSRASN
jgi:Tfp pilus assembly protein PilF